MIPTNDGVAQECSKKLQAACASGGALPSSYIVSGELVRPLKMPTFSLLLAQQWILSNS